MATDGTNTKTNEDEIGAPEAVTDVEIIDPIEETVVEDITVVMAETDEVADEVADEVVDEVADEVADEDIVMICQECGGELVDGECPSCNPPTAA